MKALFFTLIVHYGCWAGHLAYWHHLSSQGEDTTSTALFFTSAAAWLSLIPIGILYRKRNSTAYRLALVAFFASLFVSVLASPVTD